MRPEARDTGAATGGGTDRPVAVVGERIPCRDAKRRVWQALDLLQSWQALVGWVLCLYLMGLNLSNRQIAAELDLGASDAQAMTEALRGGLAAKAPPVRLQGEVEIDEVYVVAGHKGQPAAVAKRGGSAAAADWRLRRAAARWTRTSRPSSA
jgi:hypothetical protein